MGALLPPAEGSGAESTLEESPTGICKRNVFQKLKNTFKQLQQVWGTCLGYVVPVK